MALIAIYVRISDDRAGSGLGVARQEQDCRALCERRGWAVAGVYEDNDLSAYRGRPRPSYGRLLDDLRGGRVDGVVAWHPDRLHRSPVELEAFIDVIEATGATVATVQAGDLDLGTPSGRMTARIVGAVARHESEHKSERQRRKHLELAQAGKVGGGGTRPFGFEADRRTVREAEAQVIEEAAKRVLSGEALRGVVSDLTERGVTSPTGRRWAATPFSRMLTSPRVAGLRQYRGEAIGDAEWDAILDRETWEALRRVLLDPARRVNAVARSYLLTGLARCGLCQAKLVARPRDDGRRSMVCAKGPGFSGCGKIRVLAEPLEALAVEAALVAADSPALTAALAGGRSSPRAATELPGLERKLDELAEMWSAGEIERREWLAARDPLLKRRDELQAELASTARREALRLVDGGLRDRWGGLTFHQQRAVLFAILDEVTVNPAVRGRNTFDPDRISLIWRA